MPPKVSVGIVLFETEFLEESLPSLFAQNYENVEFLFRDNSGGAASRFLEERLPEIFQKAKISRGKNLFHSGGMNELIRNSRGEYFVTASGDMLYPPDSISRAVAILGKPENQKFGSLGVKLKKWDFASGEKTDVIDSCGIVISKSHRFSEIGGGEKDGAKFSKSREIFGASCALAIFRRTALDEIAVNGEFFDAKLHFKNDADLAYRLQLLGWKSLFTPEITAWHARGLGSGKPRSARSDFEKENSVFGQFVVIEKNFSEKFSWRVKFLTKLRLLAIRIFGIFFEKSAQNGFRKFERIRGKLEKSPRKVSVKEIEKLMQIR
ncbi:MAG: glycosyltransferase [Patescibacteria group bacterium]